MKKVLIPIFLLVGLITTALLWKIRDQEETLTGPPTGSGIIEATEIDLSSRIAAHVVNIAIKEGYFVEEGQLLVVLECSDIEAALSEAKTFSQVAPQGCHIQ